MVHCIDLVHWAAGGRAVPPNVIRPFSYRLLLCSTGRLSSNGSERPKQAG